MNSIQIGLGTLAVLSGLASAQPAQADHLRHAENLAQTLHHQTVDYIRWLRYHVPDSALGPQLQQDGMAVLTGVNQVQQLLLFTGGSPTELHQLHEQVHELDRLVEGVLHRLEGYVNELRHAGRNRRGRPHFPRGVPIHVGDRLSVQLGGLAPFHGHHHDAGDYHRLRDRLHALSTRLETIHRTLIKVDKALVKAAR